MSQFYTKDQTDELAGFIGRNVRDSVSALEVADLNLLNKINNIPIIPGPQGVQGPPGIQGARGELSLVTFNVDTTTGMLLMDTSADYVGATFTINNDNLEVTIQ